jgi:hypothetical protein
MGAAIPPPVPARARLYRRTARRGRCAARPAFAHAPLRVRSFAPDKPISAEAAEAAFATWPEVYQQTVDGRRPIWAARHGTKDA